MLETLDKDIMETGFLHRPLPIHYEKSLENLTSSKKVIKSKGIFNDVNLVGWKHAGPGTLAFIKDSKVGSHSIRLKSSTIMSAWPPGAPEDGDYSNFGTVAAVLPIKGQNWEEYNRISFKVYPRLEGVRNVHLSLSFKNDGQYKIPDIYGRDGNHVINLRNNELNNVSLEISELPRDRITEICFYYFINGKDISTGEIMQYDIGDINLEKINQVEVSYGWRPNDLKFVYSSSGYRLSGSKLAIASQLDTDEFEIIDAAKDKIAFNGKVKQTETMLGKFYILDFSELKVPGTYKIYANNSYSDIFTIGNTIWQPSIWKVVNFLFCERCGYPVPQKHGNCHRDLLATHNGKSLVFNGGWHDAGDVSQQLLQTAEVTFSIFEAANNVKDKNNALYLRLLEEGEWGLDFLLKTRFGDGYRATSAGVTIWSEGFIGDMDDMKARVHNNAYDNFMCSGIEAYISSMLSSDPMLRDKVLKCAEEDFGFAISKFEQTGFEEKPILWEHSFMTSESQFMAGASYSASLLYKLTENEYYAQKAVDYIDYVLKCQCNRIIGEQYPISGFFYRNTEKKIIQHFNHQAREHMFMQALSAVYESQPNHENASKWLASIKAYSGYLKTLMNFTKPYGMLPSGVYHIDEANDASSFDVQHLLTDESAKKDYIKQLKNGIKIDDEHYLRRFPVWFSFRGNSAIVLSMGKAAAICGRVLCDEDLMTIAEEQLQWIVGKNPFGQSLMYGEGTRFAQQYAVLPGEMVGEISVGVQTKNNEDIPYYPSMNNATYKEVWTTCAGRWLSIVSEL